MCTQLLSRCFNPFLFKLLFLSEVHIKNEHLQARDNSLLFSFAYGYL